MAGGRQRIGPATAASGRTGLRRRDRQDLQLVGGGQPTGLDFGGSRRAAGQPSFSGAARGSGVQAVVGSRSQVLSRRPEGARGGAAPVWQCVEIRWSGRRVARGRSGIRRHHRQRRPALAPAGGGGRGSGLERRCLLGTGRLDLWCRRRGGDRAVATGRGTPSANRHESAHLATRICIERARGLRRGGTGSRATSPATGLGRWQPSPGGRCVAAPERVARGRRRRDPVGSRLSGSGLDRGHGTRDGS